MRVSEQGTGSKMDTKQKIIEFSADCLRERGFDGFSYLDISRELGITKASVHHHFPKKEDLGLALCVWSKDWLLAGLAHFDTYGSSNWNKLERYMKAAVKHTLRDQKLCPVSAFYSDLSKLPESIHRQLKQLDELELKWVESVIEEGIEVGEFKPDSDAASMASLFIFSCKGALYHARLHGEALFSQTMQRYESILKR